MGDDMTAFTRERRQDWRWTMMIVQADVVTARLIEEPIAATMRKKDLPALDRIRFQLFTEGRSAQIMHLGPYSSEGPTIEKLHAFIAEQDLVPSGQASRDRSRRSPSQRAGAAQDDHPATGRIPGDWFGSMRK